MAARSGAFSKSRRASVYDSTGGLAFCFLKGDIKVTTQVYIYEVPLVILLYPIRQHTPFFALFSVKGLTL